MTLGEIQRNHVEATLDEFDQLGRSAFLEKYGFGIATTYLLERDGRFYDPKAVLGAAHERATGQRLQPRDFDATEAIGRLKTLGYRIVSFNGLWWVNQGATYRAERDGSYIWAPKVTKAGRAAEHHVNVSRVRVGQRVIHYSEGHIRAVGTVVNPPVEAPRPSELDNGMWGEDGYMCRVVYHELDQPIHRDRIPDRTSAVGPFDVNGGVKQGYLYKVEYPVVLDVLRFLVAEVPDFFDMETDVERLPEVSDLSESTPAPLDDSAVHDLLLTFKNVLLEGVPGTGKSFAIERLASEWQRRTGRELLRFGRVPYKVLVMHPSTSYEDFIEGLRPAAPASDGDVTFDQPAGSSRKFVVQDGAFLEACRAALHHPASDVLVLLDELNRCNVSSVFGDLLLTLEVSRRARHTGAEATATAGDWAATVPVRLPYSGRTFFVPENVYVIATANTTDRSVAPLDAALRRRFAFHRLEPEFPTAQQLPHDVSAGGRQEVLRTGSLLERLNREVLAPCLGPDALLGHSYVYALASSLRAVDDTLTVEASIRRHWLHAILPQLIDSLRSFGAEDLLTSDARTAWMADHAHLGGQAAQVDAVMSELDAYLTGLGLQIEVMGTGLARGARVTSRAASSPASAVETYLGQLQ